MGSCVWSSGWQCFSAQAAQPAATTGSPRSGSTRAPYGFGAEVALRPQHALLAGSFINSNRERSRYAGYYWRPWQWKPAGVSVKPGLVFALFDGYSSINQGDWFPAVLPSVSAECGIFGANVAFLANATNGAAIALQLKLRVW